MSESATDPPPERHKLPVFGGAYGWVASEAPVRSPLPFSSPVCGSSYGWVASFDGPLPVPAFGMSYGWVSDCPAARPSKEVAPIVGASYGWIAGSSKPSTPVVVPVFGSSYGWIMSLSTNPCVPCAPRQTAIYGTAYGWVSCSPVAVAHQEDRHIPALPVCGSSYGWITPLAEDYSVVRPVVGSSYGWISGPHQLLFRHSMMRSPLRLGSCTINSARRGMSHVSFNAKAHQIGTPKELDSPVRTDAEEPPHIERVATPRAPHELDEEQRQRSASPQPKPKPRMPVRPAAQRQQKVSPAGGRAPASLEQDSPVRQRKASPSPKRAQRLPHEQNAGTKERPLSPKLPQISSASSSDAVRKPAGLRDSISDDERLPPVTRRSSKLKRKSVGSSSKASQQGAEDLSAKMPTPRRKDGESFSSWVKRKEEQQRQREEAQRARLKQLQDAARNRAAEDAAKEGERQEREAGWDLHVVAVTTKKPVYPPVACVINTAVKDAAVILV